MSQPTSFIKGDYVTVNEGEDVPAAYRGVIARITAVARRKGRVGLVIYGLTAPVWLNDTQIELAPEGVTRQLLNEIRAKEGRELK